MPQPRPTIKRANLIAWAGGILLLLGLGLGLTSWLSTLWSAPEQTVSVGGPFTLVDDTGQTVTDATYRGKWQLIYFGYTHCPDACPTALSHIANALDELGPKASANVAPIFITVDPDRDTPAGMHDYLSAFDVKIHGLSGSTQQVAAAEAQFRVYAAKHFEKDGSYSMDHSSIIYVMNPHGDFVASFTHETTVDAMVAKLKALAV